jgi:hypothetical protein
VKKYAPRRGEHEKVIKKTIGLKNSNSNHEEEKKHSRSISEFISTFGIRLRRETNSAAAKLDPLGQKLSSKCPIKNSL